MALMFENNTVCTISNMNQITHLYKNYILFLITIYLFGSYLYYYI